MKKVRCRKPNTYAAFHKKPKKWQHEHEDAIANEFCEEHQYAMSILEIGSATGWPPIELYDNEHNGESQLFRWAGGKAAWIEFAQLADENRLRQLQQSQEKDV